MRYLATIKKPSPINSLWRKQNLHKANLQGVLFTFNKATAVYTAAGEIPQIGDLMKNPHVEVSVISEPIGEVTVVRADVPSLLPQEDSDGEDSLSLDS